MYKRELAALQCTISAIQQYLEHPPESAPFRRPDLLLYVIVTTNKINQPKAQYPTLKMQFSTTAVLALAPFAIMAQNFNAFGENSQLYVVLALQILTST
jgi:hypothetical protein